MMKEGWKYKKLGDVCDVINGLWTGKKEPFVTVAVIRNTNFSKDCKLRLKDVAFIEVEAKQFASRKLQNGDIIVEKSGGSEKQPVGRPILFDLTEGDYSFSNFTSTLRIKDRQKIDSNFLQKCLYAYYVNGETLKMQSKTTGLHNLNMKQYLRLLIPNIPLLEQKRIVKELDLLSGIIEKQKQQLKELDTFAQSIFYDMFGDPVTNEKGWRYEKLNDLCLSVIRGPFGSALKKEYFVLPSKDTYKVYEQKHAIQKDYRIGVYYIDEERFKKLRRFEVFTGDIIMSCSGTIGEFYEIPEEAEKGVINQALLKFQLALSKFDKTYFLFVMNFVKNHFDTKGTGLQNIGSVNIIKNTLIAVPPLPLQNLFASKIEAIENQKADITKSIEETQKLFDYTMDKYFG